MLTLLVPHTRINSARLHHIQIKATLLVAQFLHPSGYRACSLHFWTTQKLLKASSPLSNAKLGSNATAVRGPRGNDNLVLQSLEICFTCLATAGQPMHNSNLWLTLFSISHPPPINPLTPPALTLLNANQRGSKWKSLSQGS